MTEEQRAPYEEIAKKCKEDYNQQMELYKQNKLEHGSKETSVIEMSRNWRFYTECSDFSKMEGIHFEICWCFFCVSQDDTKTVVAYNWSSKIWPDGAVGGGGMVVEMVKEILLQFLLRFLNLCHRIGQVSIMEVMSQRMIEMDKTMVMVMCT
ncbi:hypothetical protein COCNU_08G001580 [Cocos nucifera]|uniref:Uncharacterized protein n=1 Tax=Cocos nucifera TaxID=13894 RepID=A0A8K0IHC6_COCNU|nr:hypothetical protein COCNU_08G001580 [Cocos nucifera]